MHKEAYCQQNLVMTRCSQDLVQPLFNNILGTSIHWEKKCICSYNEYITCHAISNTFIINTIWVGKLKCALLWVLHWPIHTSICWWSINHQWQYNYGPCHWKCSFRWNTICLPPDIAFQVHLLSQMNEHRGNDLNMFNQVVRCKANSVHFNVDYMQILPSKQLVQLLKRYYQLDFL